MPPPVKASHWHLPDADQLAHEPGVNPAQGLTEQEASLRTRHHGSNEIKGRPERSHGGQFIDQFKDSRVLVLMGAAVISGVIGDLIDTLAI